MATPSTLNAVIARVAAGLYDIQLGNATMEWAVESVNSVTFGGSVGKLVQSLYDTDFKSHSVAAAAIVKNVGFTGTLATDLTTYVKGLLDNGGVGHEGDTIVTLLNAFSGLTTHPDPAINAAAAAFNQQITGAINYASGLNTPDVPVHPPVSTFFTIEPETAAGADVMHLTGNQDVRIDLSNKDHQITGLDLDGDGLIEIDGKERTVSFLEANVTTVGDHHAGFEIVDAYSRNPLNHTDTANNFLGDIYFDGTGYKGDGVSTNGNIFLGGLGADIALSGDGNDFLAGGGIAQKHVPAGVVDYLSGGRNADFFFTELSLLDATDGNGVNIDGGVSADDTQAGTTQSRQDNDWLLLEASDDDEPTTIILRDDTTVDPGFDGNFNMGGTEGPIDTTGAVFTRAGQKVGSLRDVENIDASGNLYGFLDNVDVEIGGRAVDDRDGAGNSNYGIGSSAQLRIAGSNVGNVIIGGYDNDYIRGLAGDDLLMGGNLKQFLETVTGAVTNPNLDGIPNDGIDRIVGGDGNDNIVWEADGGIYDADGDNTTGAAGTSDTLWLTKYSLGVSGTAAALTTDSTLRFDLTSEVNTAEAGTPNEGGAGYGGADRAGTAEQTNFKAAANRTTVTNFENIDATGLGAIDYFAAGTNNPELKFANHQNFAGYNGNLDLRGSQVNNQIYSGEGDDKIEGRGNNAPTSGVTARTQIDDLEGNKGKDDFYFAIDGDFIVGAANNGLLGTGGGANTVGATGLSAGDGYDVIRRKIDAKNETTGAAGADGFWDGVTPTAAGGAWGQDFGLDADSSIGASSLTIDIQKAGGNPAGTELTQVIQNVVQIKTGLKPVGAQSFTPITLNSAPLQAAKTYAELTKAINDELVAKSLTTLKATLDSNGHTIRITDSAGGELADNLDNVNQTTALTEVDGAGTAINQIANTATQNTFVFGAPQTTTVQDRLIYKAYEDRSDNEGVDDDAAFGSTISLGVDAYAQDLVISFQKDASTTFGTGTTTFLAEDQRWEINFDNLTTQDRVTVTVNGVTYQLQVGYELDGTIVANEDTNSGVSQVAIQTNFLARLAQYINTFSDDDTAAGSVVAGSTPTKLSLIQHTYNGEQTVYMRAPVVTVENLSGGQTPNNPVWDNPATGAVEGAGIVNASQHEVQLYQFDGQNNKLNTQNVKFWGDQEIQRSILATSKDAGGTLLGMDSMVVDGEVNGILAKGDLEPEIRNQSSLINDTDVSNGNLMQKTIVDRLVTTNSALTVNFAVHGDDLLVTGKGIDVVRAGTGDDRVIGSIGSPDVNNITELLDGGKNYYAVKLLNDPASQDSVNGRDQARVYVLNKWEANPANIVSVLPELAGQQFTVTQIGQTQDGKTVFGAGAAAVTASAFSDTLQYQQEDFGPNAKFTITLNDFSTTDLPGGGKAVQTKNDGAGVVSIDADGNDVAESFARFTNFENIRTVSGTGAANAATPGVANSGGQGNDTLNVTALSTATGGILYNLTNNGVFGDLNGGEPGSVLYSADAHNSIPRTVAADFESLVIKVDGVERVLGGLGSDLLLIDETESAKNNTFTGDLGADRIEYRNNFNLDTAADLNNDGVSNAIDDDIYSDRAEPSLTIKLDSVPASLGGTDTVVATGGRLGLVVATDTLNGVEDIALTQNTAQGSREDDTLDVSAFGGGAIINYADAALVTGTAATNFGAAFGSVRGTDGTLHVVIENLQEVEKITGSGSSDVVLVADSDIMGQNDREDSGDDLTPAVNITLATFLDYDTLVRPASVAGTTAATLNNSRLAFVNQDVQRDGAPGVATATDPRVDDDVELVINTNQFKFNLGGGNGDTVDYSNTTDAIAVPVELLDPNKDQYVLVDADGGTFDGVNSHISPDDRIDQLIGVERIVASQGESVLDLTSSTKGLEIKFNPSTQVVGTDFVAGTATVNAYDVTSVRISDLSTSSPLSRSFIEYRDSDNNTSNVVGGTAVDKPKATWSRIEGSDNAEVVILNSAHSVDNNTFNLRGGQNQVKYNELTRSITTTLSVVDFDANDALGVVASGFTPAPGIGYVSLNPASAFQQKGTVMAVTQFQDGNNAALGGGGTHVVTSYTATNGISANASSLRIAASQDAEDTLLIAGNAAKLFLLSEANTTDNQITVRLGSGNAVNSVILTGYELLRDAPSNDVYDMGSLQTTLIGLKLVDDGTDHDTLKVGNDAVGFNDGVANTINLDSISSNVDLADADANIGFNFDFDVLDVTKVTNTNLTLIGGSNAGPANADGDATDEVVIGALSKITAINGFESVVLTKDSVAAGSSFVFNPQNKTLTQGSTSVSVTGAGALSFGGLVLEGAARNGSVADVTDAVTVTVAGAVGATVFGGAGNDVITGGGGNDILRGNGGDDTLDGGTATEVRTIQLDGILDGAANTITLTFDGDGAGAGTFAVVLTEGTAELVAGAGSVAVGNAFATKVNANLAALNAAAGWNNGAKLVAAAFDQNTGQLRFTFNTGVDVTGTITVSDTDGGTFLGSSETTATNGGDGGVDTFVFGANTAADLNGVDTINNFVAAGGASDDLLDFSPFLGGLASFAGAANITAGLSTLGAANAGVVFNKASLSAADVSLTAAAGKIAVEDNGKAVILVTADADGVADTTNNAYVVYYIEDTDKSTTAQNYVVTKVGTLNSQAEVSSSFLDATAFVGPTLVASSSAATVTETAPGNVVTFNVAAANVPNGSLITYALSGTAATAGDTSTPLTGTVVVNNGVASLPVTLLADTTTEGNEAITATFSFPGAASVASTVTVTDTSVGVAPTLAVNAAPNPVTETAPNNVVTFALATTNIPNGSVVNYTLTGAAATAADTSTPLTGTVTVTGGVASLPVTLLADNATEGNEALTATFSFAGATNAVSTVTVTDTSVGGFTDVQLVNATPNVTATAAAEAFVFDFKIVGGRVTTDVDTATFTITGFDVTKDKLVFNDTGAGIVYTEAQFKALPGVTIAENPFANNTSISVDPDNGVAGGVILAGIVDAALNTIVLETTP